MSQVTGGEMRSMWKRILGWLITLCIVIAIIYMNFGDQDTSLVKTHAKKGIMDLSSLSEESKLLSLSGEWKFIPNNFVNPKKFYQNASNQTVPAQWSTNAQYGSYQLLIYLPNHFSKVGFRVRNIWSAHKIFVNGEKVSEIGHIGTSKKTTVPKNPSYEFYLEPKTKKVLVTIYVANYYNARGGIVFPIDFGDAQAMKKDVDDDFRIEWTAVLLLLIISTFHLSIYLLRKKDDAYFYSGLYFLSLSLVVMTRGERVLLREFPNLPFEFYFRLQDSITYFSSLLLVLFMVRMVPNVMKKRQIVLFCGPLVLYSLAIIVFPARSLSSLQYVFFYYMDLLAFGIIIRLIYLIKKKRWIIPKNETVILSVLLFFIFMFSFSGAFDQLFFTGKNIFNRLGLLGFVITTNAFLGIRFINRTEEAENLNERLEKANVAKDAFLEVTMQELKNPLYDAINLMKSVSHGSDKQKNHTRELIFEQLLERFLYLVNDLQDFTRIRFQDFSFELQSTNISMVVRHVAQLMDFSFSKKQIKFEENIPETLHVLADEKRLAQVFYRILGESLSYAMDGQIYVEAHHDQNVVTIKFKATGDEIHFETEQSNIMGLSMGKELIEKMDGLLQIDKLENGVHFSVKLPFHEYKNTNYLKQETGIETKKWIAASVEGQNQKMALIVEDDPIHAEVLATMLSDRYHVLIAYSAGEALTKLNQESEISLVIVDELMPVVDGIELTKRIRQKASLIELPIIITTRVDYPSNLEAIFSAGANDYLIKPVTKETFLARLSAIEQTIRAINQSIENEMAYLQAQIKPHFLYNALSSIISFCYTDGERAAHLLTMLSSYLRYIFEAGKEGNETSLQKELEIIEAYVEVEKARFGQRLSYSCDIEKSIDSHKIMIPSLLLQPLVENAIRHGLFEKEGNGNVQLTISNKDQLLFIQVIDNGVGMSKGQCEQLIEGTMPSRGIGFTNVLRRVQELSNGHLTIDSTIGEGTTLTLMFPKKEI